MGWTEKIKYRLHSIFSRYSSHIGENNELENYGSVCKVKPTILDRMGQIEL